MPLQGNGRSGARVRWVASNRIPRKPAVEYRIWPSAQVDRNTCLSLVHRQHETVAVDAALAAQSPSERLAQCQRYVFDGVVFIDLQIPVAADSQRESAVLAELLQHVIEESDARTHLRIGLPVQIDRNPYRGFPRLSFDVCMAGIIQQSVGNAFPAKIARRGRSDFEATQSEVFGQLQIGIPVSNHG